MRMWKIHRISTNSVGIREILDEKKDARHRFPPLVIHPHDCLLASYSAPDKNFWLRNSKARWNHHTRFSKKLFLKNKSNLLSCVAITVFIANFEHTNASSLRRKRFENCSPAQRCCWASDKFDSDASFRWAIVWIAYYASQRTTASSDFKEKNFKSIHKGARASAYTLQTATTSKLEVLT